jgi:hypothetical protein
VAVAAVVAAAAAAVVGAAAQLRWRPQESRQQQCGSSDGDGSVGGSSSVSSSVVNTAVFKTKLVSLHSVYRMECISGIRENVKCKQRHRSGPLWESRGRVDTQLLHSLVGGDLSASNVGMAGAYCIIVGLDAAWCR